MSTMRAIQIASANADLELVERPIPEPGPGQVRIKVSACGICHSDVFVKAGIWPGIEYPRVPGHEVTGTIDAVGEDVTAWSKGARVGVGWHGDHCFTCTPCREGDFIACANHQVTGISFDGGYAEYMLAPAHALASLPDDLSFADAAPLLCAGITVFNALRNSGARPGDRVAIQGIGGLGHLGVQYARAMGFETIALSGTQSKRELALELGAHHFIAASDGDPAEALQELGGARVILATSPSADAASEVVDGLSRDGRLIAIGASGEPMKVSSFQLINGRKGVEGWPSGQPSDSDDALRFSALFDIKPMIETFPLEEAPKAFDHALSNEARFRVVLEP